jgi:threonine/homoserine/homoserine lactone efflux protein
MCLEMEMDPLFFLRGFGIGFAIAIGVGPITLLTIRRTLEHGRIYGLASGVGVAFADATYGGIAAFGLAALTTVLVGARVALGLIGGAFLLYLGWKTMTSRPRETAAEASERPGLLGAAASIYGLTMTNPMTILSFAAAFAGLGIVAGSGLEAALLTLGVWCGSAAWWVILTAVVAALRSRVTLRALTWVNRATGVLIFAFGVVAIALGVSAIAG